MLFLQLSQSISLSSSWCFRAHGVCELCSCTSQDPRGPWYPSERRRWQQWWWLCPQHRAALCRAWAMAPAGAMLFTPERQQERKLLQTSW